MNIIHQLIIACPVCAAQQVLPVAAVQQIECAECGALAVIMWTHDEPDLLSVVWKSLDFQFAPQPATGGGNA